MFPRNLYAAGLAALIGPLSTIAATPAEAAEPQTLGELKSAILDIRDAHDIPALAVAIADADGPIWVEAIGRANIETQTAAGRDTLFRIGSVSKMFVALSVLKLVEQGTLGLNDTVHELAPEVKFTNPWHGTHPVRIVHLLEHTTGWSDMGFAAMANSTPLPLNKAVHLYPDSRVSRWVPGSRMAYSNIGPAVTAYIIEKMTGQTFESYVEANFFKPLNMKGATYFEPADSASRIATAYLDGRPQQYMHLLYRPAGAINASIADMTRLLQFMIQRGTFDNQQVLNSQSINRMETPGTALGAGQGVTAGCGLHNCTSGFQNRGVAFYGHNGGGPGYSAQFTYSPELESGFVLQMTGDGAAQPVISDLIRGFLIKDTRSPLPQDIELPEQFRANTGLYRPITPRFEFVRAITDLTDVMHFSDGDNTFHRSPLFGNWQSSDIPNNDGLLVDRWTGLPTVAVVHDPLAGEAVAVGAGTLYKPVSAWKVYGTLTLFALLVVVNIATLVYSLVWLTGTLRGRSKDRTGLTLRLFPVLCGYVSCMYFLLLSKLFPGTTTTLRTIEQLGTLTWTSGGLFVFSLAYFVVSAAGIVWMLYHRKRIPRRSGFWTGIAALLVHFSINLYLASYGLTGFRSWVT